MVGICNGLICLCDDRATEIYPRKMPTITIWNPTIKKALHLPQPNVESNMYTLGFGFDPISNDYKVVRIAYKSKDPRERHVELYNQSSGVWRYMGILELDLKVGMHNPWDSTRRESPVFMNGAVHWIAFTEHIRAIRYSIVLFDMQHDMFKEMALPGALDAIDLRKKAMSVTIWERKQMLSVIIGEQSITIDDNKGRITDCGGPTLSVWTMKEYGVAESWTKLYDINDIPALPVRFLRNGELLFKNMLQLFSYKHDRIPKIENLQICCSLVGPFNDCSFYVDYYTESLMLLDQQAT